MPIIQLCIDVITLDAAIEIAEMGLRAGVDWLELGTPLVSFAGINSFASFTSRFPGSVVFLDAKVMDGAKRYVESAADLGIALVCLCASASDATFRAAIAAGQTRGVKIVGDLYAVDDPFSRAKELVDIGVDYIYLHYGYDQNNERADEDPTLKQLAQVKAITSLPVGIVTANIETAEKAVRSGADIVLVGHPFLLGPEAEERLTEYVRRVRGAAPSTPVGVVKLTSEGC